MLAASIRGGLLGECLSTGAGLNEAAGWVKRARRAESLAEMPAVAGAQFGAEGL